MTYYEMHELVLSEADIYIQMGFSAVKTLIWISEAIHQYQVLTGVSRCIQSLDLDPDSDDGKYTIDEDISVIEKIDYYPESGTVGMPVNQVDYDTLFRLQQQGAFSNPVGFTFIQNTQQILGTQTNKVLSPSLPSPFCYALYGSCNLFFYPFVGASGMLKIYYKPYLNAYAPSAKGRWSKFGMPPDALMKVTDLPREFWNATEGIKGYCMMKMLPKIPNHRKIYPGLWEQYQADFKSAVERILITHPPSDRDAVPTPNMLGRIA